MEKSTEFWHVDIFDRAPSIYLNKSHNFVNLVFVTMSLKAVPLPK